MTIEQILLIEPALEVVENYVKTKNEQGKKEIVHWCLAQLQKNANKANRRRSRKRRAFKLRML